MENFDLLSVIYYCLFISFVNFQQIHNKKFKGANDVFGVVLYIFELLGYFVATGYLIYYGIHVVWWAPFVIILIGMLFVQLSKLLTKLVNYAYLSLLGFIAWPLFAYFMFITIP